MTQPTLSVLDSTGTKRTINTTNPNGPANAADSQSVVLATDQTLPLPLGAATDANLTAVIGTLHTDLVSLLAKLVTGGSTDAAINAAALANHADLAALLAKIPVLPTGSGETNRAVTTVANTAIVLMAANPARKYFEIQNLDATVSLYFRKDGNDAGINLPGSFTLAPGAFYSGQSTGKISIISTIASHSFTAVEA